MLNFLLLRFLSCYLCKHNFGRFRVLLQEILIINHLNHFKELSPVFLLPGFFMSRVGSGTATR